MKNSLIVFLLFITSGLLAQQSQTRTIGSFTGIKVAEGVDVYLKKGDKEGVRVEVTGTQAENVITEISGSYLKVHMKDGNYRGNVDAKVYVTYVMLDKLSASSAGNIFSDGQITATDMEINASSAGSIEVAVDAKSISVSVSSAAEIELKGKVKSLSLSASSAGEIDAYDLESQKVNAEASSAGSIRLSVVQDLRAHASSGGSIRYRGSPSKSVTDSSSGGSVRKSD
jgi:Putative auto-transporter adhesin, head GIN domain